jgi:hypothetical protein
MYDASWYIRPYLGDKLSLLELPIDKNHSSILVNFRATQAGFRCRLGCKCSSIIENRRVVAILVMVWEVVWLQSLVILLSCEPEKAIPCWRVT